MSDISSSLCVAILTTGQMGSSLGSLLSLSNIRVITDASKRSSRTQSLASQAGIEDVGSIQAVLRQADIVLSVLVPSEAFALAASLIDVVSVGDHANLRVKYFVDLNAIAPKTARNIAQICDCTGIQFIDGGIMGGPASSSQCPLIVLSGTGSLYIHETLSAAFLHRTKIVGEEIGAASALKLTYASLNKGALALAINAGMLAKEWGVDQALEDELEKAGSHMLNPLRFGVSKNIAKSHRWIGEMDEISQAYADSHIMGGAGIFKGMSTTYSFTADTELGRENIEDSLEKNRSHVEVFSILKQSLKEKKSEFV